MRDGQQTRGVEGSGQFFFADNPLLGGLERDAKNEGLQFIDELIFENGAVYKGKSETPLTDVDSRTFSLIPVRIKYWPGRACRMSFSRLANLEKTNRSTNSSYDSIFLTMAGKPIRII